jgi:protein SCO1/2
MNRRLLAALAALGVILLFVLLGWWALSRRPYSFHGETVEPAAPAADFTLTDVCPTTMASLAQAMRELGAKADGVQVLMVTVDPQRDTAARLNSYVTAFDPSFIGLSGTPDQIAGAAKAFEIVYQVHAGSSATNYLVDHTATTTVLDKNGRIRLIWPYGTPPEELVADLDQLLR